MRINPFDHPRRQDGARAVLNLQRRRLLAMTALGAVGVGPAAAATAACTPLLSREFPRLQDEKAQNLCQYAGKVIVVVNTASFCGFTPQYKSLEALYARYKDRGLVVLGFPSNDFGAQEPGSGAEIAAFCENTFGVKFPMFAKSRVAASAGAAANPLIADLAQRTGQWPRWNFHKYLVARDGSTASSHVSDVDPLDKAFIRQVESLLDAKS
jgi:glutathione peroxidase